MAFFDYFLNNIQIIFVFSLVVFAVYFYMSEKISMEMTSISVLSSLMLFFYFFPVLDENGNNYFTVSKIIAGFSNASLITIVSLMIIGEAIAKTGIVSAIASYIAKRFHNFGYVVMLCIMLLVFVMSAFLNNIPIVVVFIPIIQHVCKNLGINNRKWLMPLSFVAIVGGMTTLIGSSTNILVSATLEEIGYPSIGFYDFTEIGLILSGAALLYILFVIPFFMKSKKTKRILSDNNERNFIFKTIIDENNPLLGCQVVYGKVGAYDIDVINVKRSNKNLKGFKSKKEFKFKDGDEVSILGSRDDVLKISNFNLDIFTSAIESNEDIMLDNSELFTAEVMVSHNSGFIGQKMNEVSFTEKYNCAIVGVDRESENIIDFHSYKFKHGDILFIKGTEEDINEIRGDTNIILLEWSQEELRNKYYVFTTLLVFLGVIGLSSFQVLPIAISSFVGATILILSKCISFKSAVESINRQIIILICASLALGYAVSKTGAADLFSHYFVLLTSGLDIVIILAMFFSMVVFVTNILSNQATAILFTPVAVSLANELNVNIYIFIYAVIFAANCSFLSPIGYHTNLLVMSPGKYEFRDYFKFGFILTVIIGILYCVVASYYFNL